VAQRRAAFDPEAFLASSRMARRLLGFIESNGELKIGSSLLTVVLHD
jgi:hypothetical protein